MGLSRSSPGSPSACMTLSIRSLPASFFNCTVYALPNSEICRFTWAESVGSLINSTARTLSAAAHPQTWVCVVAMWVDDGWCAYCGGGGDVVAPRDDDGKWGATTSSLGGDDVVPGGRRRRP
eukprot:scaffold4944_cov65-Phaeocystis_antarctica.AAC.2